MFNPLLAQNLFDRYPLFPMERIIRKGALKQLPTLPDCSSALVVSEANAYALYGRSLVTQVPFPRDIYLVPSGEEAKQIAIAAEGWLRMTEFKCDRKSAVITLGGGAICDLGGFIASTYMRGVTLIHCPTTLLAMVDASVGGKTALNLAGEKNLIGSFHHPSLVIADLDTLESLEEVEMQAGFAEVVKMGMIADPALLEMEDLEAIIARCVELKLEICQADPTSGKRHLLNWGHTFAHAIEARTYHRVKHGPAVAMGMSLAARLSVLMGLANPSLIEIQEEALERRGLSSTLPPLDLEKTIELMKRDKKGSNGEITCVLSKGVGQMERVHGIDPELIREAFEQKIGSVAGNANRS